MKNFDELNERNSMTSTTNLRVSRAFMRTLHNELGNDYVTAIKTFTGYAYTKTTYGSLAKMVKDNYLEVLGAKKDVLDRASARYATCRLSYKPNVYRYLKHPSVQALIGYDDMATNINKLVSACDRDNGELVAVNKIDDVEISQSRVAITCNLKSLHNELRGWRSVVYKNGSRLVVSGVKLDDYHFQLALAMAYIEERGEKSHVQIEKVYAKVFGNDDNRFVSCSKTLRGLKANHKKNVTKQVTAALRGNS